MKCGTPKNRQREKLQWKLRSLSWRETQQLWENGGQRDMYSPRIYTHRWLTLIIVCDSKKKIRLLRRKTIIQGYQVPGTRPGFWCKKDLLAGLWPLTRNCQAAFLRKALTVYCLCIVVLYSKLLFAFQELCDIIDNVVLVLFEGEAFVYSWLSF